MSPETMSALTVLSQIREAAWDSVERKRKLPGLLLLYAFIDVCASLADEHATRSNSRRFKAYVERYGWQLHEASVAELWAARSALLHAFSPIGWNTKDRSLRPIFYFAAPEEEEHVRA